jgi:glucokinase
MNVSDLVLALDFGGTKLSAAVTRRGERQWRERRMALSKPGATAQDDLALMDALAGELLGTVRPAAVGVSFGGPALATSGTVRLSDHVPGWEDYPLRERLERRYGVPASVDNDANVAALGEYRYGAGQSCDSLLYVTVSTGVGGGWVLNGEVWRGAGGMAGEIGHTVADPQGPPCFCGKRGCVERLASGPYIAARAREWLREQPGRGERLRALVGGDLKRITAKDVAEAAAEGDELAWEALQTAAWALGLGLGNAVNLINPQRIVLGGGVMKSGARFWEALRATSRATARKEMRLDIVPAALGDDAPLWGAVALAEDRLPS